VPHAVSTQAVSTGRARRSDAPRVASTAVLLVLEQLAALVGGRLDLAKARHLVEGVRPDDPDLFGIESAAAAMGVIAERMEVRVAALAGAGTLPLVLVHPQTGRSICVRAAKRMLGLVRVYLVDDGTGPRLVREQTLAKWLGVGAGDPVLGFRARAAEPLAAVKSDGGHAMPPLRRLRALLALERDEIAVAVIYALGVGVVSLAVPIGVQALVGSVAFGGLLQPIVVLALLVLGGLVMGAVLSLLQHSAIERVQRRLFTRVSLDLAHRLPRVHVDSIARGRGPELVNRFFDVPSTQKALATLLMDGLGVLLSTFVGMALLALYHPYLSGARPALGARPRHRRVRLRAQGHRDGHQRVEGEVRDGRLARGARRAPRHLQRPRGRALALTVAEERTRDYLAARKKHFSVVIKQSAFALGFAALASASLLGVGGVLVLNGQLTVGQLVASELVVTLLASGLSKLGKHLETAYDLVASVDKIGVLLDLPTETEAGQHKELPSGPATIELLGVTAAAYGRTIVRDATTSIAAGHRVAITGPSGSGRSTMLELLYGVRRPELGALRIDGIDIRSLDLESLREGVALVRDGALVEGTIVDNVRFGRLHVSTREIYEALASVGVEGSSAALPQGPETVVSEGAPELPAVDRARVLMARALAGRPRVVLLDEPTAGLDPRARVELASLIRNLERHTTVVLVSNDPVLLRVCDRVLVLDEGTLSDAPPSSRHDAA
jgi:putative ABC transport system ATP-binding protein